MTQDEDDRPVVQGPSGWVQTTPVSVPQLSLRDLYAYKAMDRISWAQSPEGIAHDCYAVADAMLAEREKA